MNGGKMEASIWGEQLLEHHSSPEIILGEQICALLGFWLFNYLTIKVKNALLNSLQTMSSRSTNYSHCNLARPKAKLELSI
jgi:hypothetical protein